MAELLDNIANNNGRDERPLSYEPMEAIQEHLAELFHVVQEADRAVMEVYDNHSAIVEIKADNSPITQADRESHEIISKGLLEIFPEIPVVSEEGDDADNRNTVLGNLFWLVDPIDGTKEFINRTDEFSICIALVENGIPVFAIVSAPALNIQYYGGPAMGSYKIEGGEAPQKLHVSREKVGVIVGSRSNREAATDAYIAQHYAGYDMIQIGSQLKMPLIAEGKADAFPRIDGPLHLWDLAAQQAILEGAGGVVTRPDGSLIDYREESLMAGDFVGKSTR